MISHAPSISPAPVSTTSVPPQEQKDCESGDIFSELTKEPHILYSRKADIRFGETHYFRIKTRENEIEAKYKSPYFGAAVIGSVLWNSVLLFLAYRGIFPIPAYVFPILFILSLTACVIAKRMQKISHFSLWKREDSWHGKFEDKEFKFQYCLIVNSTLEEDEHGNIFRKPSGRFGSQIYFISDGKVSFSILFSITNTNCFSNAFSKVMSREVYRGVFEKTRKFLGIFNCVE